MSLAKKQPHLPPLQLHGKHRTKAAHGPVFNPAREAIADIGGFDDLNDDVRDLVIGSPLPQAARPETAKFANAYVVSKDRSKSADFPAIHVQSIDDSVQSTAGNATSGVTCTASVSPESSDRYDAASDHSLSPSPKLFRRKQDKHVKYYTISDDDHSAATAPASSAQTIDDVTMWFDLKHRAPSRDLEMSPSLQRKPARLSPILSPSSMSPALSPYTSPVTSPGQQRRKQRLSVENLSAQ